MRGCCSEETRSDEARGRAARAPASASSPTREEVAKEQEQDKAWEKLVRGGHDGMKREQR